MLLRDFLNKINEICIQDERMGKANKDPLDMYDVYIMLKRGSNEIWHEPEMWAEGGVACVLEISAGKEKDD